MLVAALCCRRLLTLRTNLLVVSQRR